MSTRPISGRGSLRDKDRRRSVAVAVGVHTRGATVRGGSPAAVSIGVLALVVAAWLSGASRLAVAAASPEDAGENYFNDPFLQATAGIADCPPPLAPRITQAEMRTEAHARSDRGTRCYASGQCRLPNAYLYDKEIVPRAKLAILADGGFTDTSIWLVGQRRWVSLKGCVRSRKQAEALEKLVRRLDDVEAVVNELVLRPR